MRYQPLLPSKRQEKEILKPSVTTFTNRLLPIECYQNKKGSHITTLVTGKGGKPGNRALKLLKYMSIPLLPPPPGNGVS